MTAREEIVLCGLDGVLALIEHRLHHLHNDTGERDWDAFHAACVDDMPNLPLIQRLKQARDEGYPVILITGRSAAVRSQTEGWLQRWRIGHDGLWMRPVKDRAPAAELKARLIERHLASRRIRRVYESTQQLDFARWCTQHGIPCTLFGPNQGNGGDRELFDLRPVRHTCGHVALYPFYGDDDYAWDERCAQLAEGTCMLCQAAEAADERRRHAEQVRLAARERGLPPLEGSERQVDWAEGIRLNALAASDKVHAWIARHDAEAMLEDPDHWAAVKRGVARATAYLERQVEARWWIDHRHGIMNTLEAGRALLSAVAEQQGYL